jgi:hypothetical protein
MGPSRLSQRLAQGKPGEANVSSRPEQKYGLADRSAGRASSRMVSMSGSWFLRSLVLSLRGLAVSLVTSSSHWFMKTFSRSHPFSLADLNFFCKASKLVLQASTSSSSSDSIIQRMRMIATKASNWATSTYRQHLAACHMHLADEASPANLQVSQYSLYCDFVRLQMNDAVSLA